MIFKSHYNNQITFPANCSTTLFYTFAVIGNRVQKSIKISEIAFFRARLLCEQRPILHTPQIKCRCGTRIIKVFHHRALAKTAYVGTNPFRGLQFSRLLRIANETVLVYLIFSNKLTFCHRHGSLKWSYSNLEKIGRGVVTSSLAAFAQTATPTISN